MGVTRRSLVWITFLLTGTGTWAAAVHFDDFGSTQGLSFAGDAAVSGKALRLTRAKWNRSGAVWFGEKQPVASGFETSFEFRLTHQGGDGHGADGFAFVMQNAGPEALGGLGSAGGFAVSDPSYFHRRKAIPWSIAVFFDTFRNENEGDPSDNFVSVRTYGKPSEMRWPAPRIALTPNLPFQLKDGNVHTARIVFRPPVLSVFLDDSPAPVLESVVDLSIILDEQGRAWVGFTASTGGGYENHDILNWSFTGADVSSTASVVSSHITFLMSDCLPDRKLCTPEKALVEHRDAGYHVVLPGNLEWGASIPISKGQAFTVTNAHGIVCWDINAQGPGGCSGPAGNGTAAGPGFLATDSPAGALIMKTHDDQTRLSVNGRTGDFKNNEGFYEFDVEIK